MKFFSRIKKLMIIMAGDILHIYLLKITEADRDNSSKLI